MEEGFVSSVDALAAALGRKPRSLHYLLNDGLRAACRFSDGTYSIELAQQWMAENGKGGASGKKDALAPLKKKQLRAKIAISAEDLRAKRLKNDHAAGLLIYRDEVLEDFSDLLNHAKPLCDALPEQIAKEAPQEARVRILELVTHAMERFYHHLASWEPKGEPIVTGPETSV